MEDILTVNGLCKSFGGIAAVQDISMRIPRGKIVSLIGPNGAGKTSVFNLLTGFYEKDAGTIGFEGAPLEGLKAYDYVKRGIVRTFQNVRLYSAMSVLDNVMVGNQYRIRYSPLDIVFNTRRKRRVEEESRTAALALLEELGLSHLAYERCDALSYGQQKKLEIVRAMASAPKLLLLDEPAAGLNPLESEELSVFVAHLIDRGFTILLIEHDISLVMSISDYVYVMDHGRMLSEGMPEQVQRDPAVIEAYIGKRGMQDVIAGKSP